MNVCVCLQGAWDHCHIEKFSSCQPDTIHMMLMVDQILYFSESIIQSDSHFSLYLCLTSSEEDLNQKFQIWIHHFIRHT